MFGLIYRIEKIMKSTLKILLLTGTVMGVFLFSPSGSQLASADAKVSITIPAPALDLSDLDVRDKFNRRLSSPKAKKQLENLFVSGLQQLLMNPLTPGVRSILYAISRSWKMSFGWIHRVAKESCESSAGWLTGKKFKIPLDVFRNGRLQSVISKCGHAFGAMRNSFQFLISLVVSSTQLLR
ncbi:MAG: hypothetical protein LHV69_07590 [Elusimicrobia bacterium]|nr:hypothetical protein [Candidatus Obscuribacterium magneticum]